MEQIEKQTKLAGRNISFDRLYTSTFLSVWLLDRKITSIGTLQHNRKGIPVELKVTKGKEELSSEIYWEKSKGKMTLSSYIVNTSKGTKSVILLSTHEPILRTTKDDNKKKPALFKVYDFTKGGTDVIDQRKRNLHCSKFMISQKEELTSSIKEWESAPERNPGVGQ